jgi:hypothetical protein
LIFFGLDALFTYASTLTTMGNLYKEVHDTREGSTLKARGWKTQNKFSRRVANNKLCVAGTFQP